MGQPLAVPITGPGPEIAAGHLRERDVETGVPLPFGGAGLAVQIGLLNNGGAEACRAGHRAVAALDAAVGHLDPAWVVQLQLEPLAYPGHRQRLAHLSPDRLDVVDGSAGLRVRGAAGR